MPKLFKILLGSVHFKTRFLPFIKNHPNTLDQFVFIVDHYELYEPYKDKVEIINIEDLRANHPWSKENEILLHEPNPDEYARKFIPYYENINNVLPVGDFSRFAIQHYANKGQLKFAYIANNFFFHDNSELIKRQLEQIRDKTFYFFTSAPVAPRYPNIDWGHYIDFESRFPSLTWPQDTHWVEYKCFVYSFASKEHAELFYEIWDYALSVIYERKDGSLSNFYLQRNYGYTMMDELIGYIVRVFDVNFGYKTELINPLLEQTKKGEQIGRHISFVFDQFYYRRFNRDTIGFPGWRENQDDYSVEAYVEKHKDILYEYFLTQGCDESGGSRFNLENMENNLPSIYFNPSFS